MGSGRVFSVTEFSITPTTCRYERLELQSHHLCAPSSSKKKVIYILHSRRFVGSSAQTLQVGVTSDGERNGPVRIAKGGGENALLKGGEIEAEEPGGWRSRMALEQDGRGEDQRHGRQR